MGDYSRQLLSEFKQICYQFDLNISTPIIRIAPLQSAWGQWSTQPRMITIAKRLIEDYPWTSVIEVLKHEMAHQMVSELHNSDEQHGELFRQCARQLAMSDWAMRANFEIDDKVYASELDSLANNENPALRRVRKLLALGQSKEEHEAALAMQKAREISLKHNLKSVGKCDDECVMHVINTRSRRIKSEQLAICGLLMTHFPVYAILNSMYDASEGISHRVIELYGNLTDIKTAEYVYYYLLNQMQQHWRVAKHTEKCKSSYYRGLIAGFDAKLASNKPTGQALIVDLQARAKHFATSRCPKTHATTSQSRRSSYHSYGAGFAVGKQLDIRKGVTQSNTNFLLTS